MSLAQPRGPGWTARQEPVGQIVVNRPGGVRSVNRLPYTTSALPSKSGVENRAGSRPIVLQVRVLDDYEVALGGLQSRPRAPPTLPRLDW